MGFKILEELPNSKKYYRFKSTQFALLLQKIPWVARELSQSN